MKRLFALLLIVCLWASVSCEEDHVKPPGDFGPMDTGAPLVCDVDLTVDEQQRTIAMTSTNCAVSYSDMTGQLALIQGQNRIWHDFDEWPQFENSTQGEATTLSFYGHNFLPDLTLTLTPSEKGFIVDADLAAVEQVTVAGLRLTGNLALPETPTQIHWYHNGHDSWSFTGIVKINNYDKPPSQIQGAPAPVGNNYNYWGDKVWISWWNAAVRGAYNRAGLVAGALSANLFKTYYVTAFNDFTKTWQFNCIIGTPGDSKLIAAGQNLSLDSIYYQVAADPVWGMLDYADEVAWVIPPLKWTGFSPKGWASWYDYFDKVTEEDILLNMAKLKADYFDDGFEVCQLDDGYMTYWGDWQETNERFPSGLGPLAEAIDDAGLVPGIWMAPVMANQASTLVAEHPDWFLRNEKDEFRIVGDFSMTDKFILDVTHPDAAAWLKEQIEAMVDLGYRYLKLDFLLAGSVESARYEQNVTSMEAYARAVEIISDAAGQGVYLLACGAPILPSAGRFHAARTSSDIVASIFDAPSWRMVHNIARMNVGRFFTDGKFFANDPDQLVIRNPLSMNQAELAIASNVLLGSNLWLGDALVNLPPAKQDLILSEQTAFLESLSGPTIPIDLFLEASPRVVPAPYVDYALADSVTPSVYLKNNVLIIINWYTKPRTFVYRPTDLGFEPGDKVVATQRRTGDRVDVVNGRMVYDISGQQMLIYTLQTESGQQ